MLSVLSIAAGGALGAVTRHFVNVGAVSFGVAFPWGTLFINVTGSFVMGLAIGLFAHVWQPPQETRSFLTVGFLGGLTTFSTFSLDAVTLYERGEVAMSALYIAASVIISIAGLFAGLYLVRIFSA